MTDAAQRIVCISGGTSGIGAGLVAAFIEAGDRVVTFGRDPDKVAALAQQWGHAVGCGSLRLLVGDVTHADFRDRLVAEIRDADGRLDVLVNNAGVILSQGDLEETVEAWRATLEVNLIAPFALTQVFLGLLEQSAAPVVINMSSACAQHPFETCTSTSYSASKAGLEMLTKRLAMALGARGIRVNAVAPGVVESPMWGGATDLIASTVKRRHRLRQDAVEPSDVARAVVFLASEDARRITGACLNVDAGYALG
ncbi:MULTISPECIES: SDR family NAD(P)-dependent oxidoreductase [unclassified Thiocapsa]|uniref:SDR family NAD(P)-dependent oxidoreductase n=1 Tax=unclassified Thiocapsa TaxID=2641286 RepID=UPI0035B211FC